MELCIGGIEEQTQADVYVCMFVYNGERQECLGLE